MSATLITPTTELEAVNECLFNINQAPINSVEGNLPPDARTALDYIVRVSRALQAEGWHWNTDDNFELTPTVDGDVILPDNCLFVQSYGEDRTRRLTSRGRLLYDQDNSTFKFSEPVTVSITRGLPFDDLPELARRYISLRAARILQNREEGQSDSEDSRDEFTARAQLEAERERVENNNTLTDNFDTFNILNRYQ